MMYEKIPLELKKLKQWVCCDAKKTPRNAYNGKNAMPNNPDTWATFDIACKAVEMYGFQGIGFMFAGNYFGVDLDKCIDNQDFVDEFVETLQSYTEISRSGQGIHIICKGDLPQGNRRRGNVEMYNERRYFIMTGNLYNEKYDKIVDCTETIKVLHSKYLADNLPKIAPKTFETISMDDSMILDKARNCKSGAVFQLLYDGQWQGIPNMSSQSDADFALCKMLAFWCQKNKDQIDRIFRNSGLYRDKWDSKRGQTTYGALTIDKACAYCVDVYQPRTDDTSIAVAIFENGKIKSIEEQTEYDMTDTGNAHMFKDKYMGNIRYSFVNRCWYYWTGRVWTIDQTGEIKKLADEVCEDLKRNAFAEEDADSQKAKLQWAQKTASSKGKENMLKETQHLDGIPILPIEMDAYNDFFNCQNGIINLRNGELIPHDNNFCLSKISFAEYDVSDAIPKLWLQFLDDVTNHNKDLQRYLQKCVGYSLTGSIREQCIFILYGMGNNGKSTFLDTISDVLGTYAANIQPETIMEKKHTNSANSDVARLKSARFVTCEEATEGIRLNEGLIKQLTGGGKITARFLYGSEFEFVPEFKIWESTNHLPYIRGTDNGIWRRIRLIPFEVNIPKEKVDKNLKWKLKKELPQILKWAVEGCLLWQKEGIEMPECVEKATNNYKSEMDLLQEFVDECVTIDYESKEEVPALELYNIYVEWCDKRKERAYSNRKFGMEITKKLPEKIRKGTGIYYTKIKTNVKSYNYADFK